MITRPLELSSRLRPVPRAFDAVFYVNAGLIVVFFMLFGSRFVASAGLMTERGGEGARIPEFAGAASNSRPTSHLLMMLEGGGLYDLKGRVFPEELDSWLRTAASQSPDASLLIFADERVSFGEVSRLEARAYRAGFRSVVEAANEPFGGGP